MRAKITKTVDIGDVPSESRKMIDQSKNILMYYMPEKMSEIVRYSLSSNAEEFFHATELIRLFRQLIKNYDENLQEIEHIMDGYKEYIYKQAEQEQVKQQEASEYSEEQKIQTANASIKRQEEDQQMMDKIDSFLSEAAIDEAQYEKFMSQVMGAEDGHESAEDEEG
jgi:cobalamin biosynthesis protein CbiD